MAQDPSTTYLIMKHSYIQKTIKFFSQKKKIIFKKHLQIQWKYHIYNEVMLNAIIIIVKNLLLLYYIQHSYMHIKEKRIEF